MVNNAGQQGGDGNEHLKKYVLLTVKVSFCFIEASGLGIFLVRKFSRGFETQGRKSKE
jgi:hypothetical protein